MDAEPVLKYRPSKPKPRRKKVSPCRCLAYTSLVFGIAIGCAIAFIIIKSVWGFIDIARHPHKAHHYNGTLEDFEPVDTDIVPPILGADTRFDVAVALWYSLPEDEQDNIDNTTATEGEKSMMEYLSLPLRDIRPIPKQSPLFSDVIIRNASFGDKHIHRQITYQLPLERFRARKLGSYDVRATFVLLPLNSDRFNRMTNFSDWKLNEIAVAPVLPPANAHSFAAQYPFPRIAEELMQSWGSSLPLIRFHEIPSQCAFVVANATEQHDDVDVVHAQGQDGIGADTLPAAYSLYKKHPHLVSRTHMIVVSEDRLYNRTAFLKRHSDLQKMACKGPAFNLPRHYRFCQKNYIQNGEFGLKVDLDNESGTETEIGYLPYLGFVDNAAGPKDVIPVPVNRETCEALNNDTAALRFPENDTHINVTWNLQFSCVSAGRVGLVDHFLPPPATKSQINATERELVVAHDAWEQHAGLMGHRTEGAHPWTRFFTALFTWPIFFAVHLLEVLYWYSRTSIAGLDIWATGFQAAHIVLDSFCPMIYDKDQSWQTSGWPTRMLFLLFIAWAIIPAVLMVKLMSPFEVTWSTWTKMEIHRSRLSHQERASKRIVSQISPIVHLTAVPALAVARYLISYFRLNPDLIAPLVEHEHVPRGAMEIMLFNLDFGFKVSAALFQIIMNRRSGTFAGQYRITAMLSSLATLLWIARLSQTLIGKRNPTYSFDTLEGLIAAIELYTAYQAFTLPSVKQDTVDEDEE